MFAPVRLVLVWDRPDHCQFVNRVQPTCKRTMGMVLSSFSVDDKYTFSIFNSGLIGTGMTSAEAAVVIGWWFNVHCWCHCVLVYDFISQNWHIWKCPWGELQVGPKPIVIIENHPYVLATWKLGGVLTLLDYHVPWSVCYTTMRLAVSTESAIQKILKSILFLSLAVCQLLTRPLLDFSFPSLPFDLKDTTITTLSQRHLNQVSRLPASLFPAPTPEDITLYLHTSSVSTISNVECVSISHKNFINSSQSRLSWFKKVWPHQDFNNPSDDYHGLTLLACATTLVLPHF